MTNFFHVSQRRIALFEPRPTYFSMSPVNVLNHVQRIHSHQKTAYIHRIDVDLSLIVDLSPEMIDIYLMAAGVPDHVSFWLRRVQESQREQNLDHVTLLWLENPLTRLNSPEAESFRSWLKSRGYTGIGIGPQSNDWGYVICLFMPSAESILEVTENSEVFPEPWHLAYARKYGEIPRAALRGC